MIKRNERRRRIETAFIEFQTAVAAALGAASKDHAEAAIAHAKLRFELRVRQIGSDKALDDPVLAEELHNPALAAIMQRALDERERIFAAWTTTGPRQIEELVATAAPSAAAAPWQEWLGAAGEADGSGQVPELWRIGTAVVDSAPVHQEFPVAVPLLEDAHLHVTSTPQRRADAEALVEGLLLRVLSYFQPGLVQVHVWDVGQLTGSLPGLYPLARAGLFTVHDPARLHELLDDLSDHVRRIHTSMLVEGHVSLRALSSTPERRGEPWRIAVLFGNRRPLEEKHQQTLQRIARNGLACGVQLIIVDIPVTVNSAVETVTLADSTTHCTMAGPHATVALDPPLPSARIPRACGAIANALAQRRSRRATFEDLLPATTWTQQSASGLHTPVGFADGEQVSIHLGDAAPHALIGGPSGSGKTNLLYALLAGLTARYSPDELELYLLDFKEGVSFAQFAPGRKDPSWLPHARLVGINVNQDREFGLALLRFLADELRRRAAAAKQHEVTKLEELRAEDPGGRWPRIVAVIDEFQYLFAQRDSVTAKSAALLEDVARRGRSQGIHLVLSSQDVAGIEAFWGKPAIFEQFTLRVALPKARRVLAENNDAAMEIPRWHAVVNHESGVPLGNQVVRVPDATSRATVEKLQAQLWHMRQQELPQPRLFDGSHEPALRTLPDYLALAPRPDREPTALLGQVIDVAGSAAAVAMARTPGRNLAVIGSVRQEAAGALAAGALSLARQHAGGDVTFTLGCPIEEARPDAERLASELRRIGHDVRLVGIEDIRSILDDTAAALTARLTGGQDQPRPHYFLLYAVDATHALLDHKHPETRHSGLDSLRTVLKHGPELGTHTIGWWRSVQRLKTILIGGAVDDIGAWVAFDVQGQELSSLAAGALISWSPRPHRGLFFDRSEHARPEVIIPFDVWAPADVLPPAEAAS